MPTFVHITSKDAARKMLTGGLRMPKVSRRPIRGIFAMPVTPNFQTTHQWMRELRQWRSGELVGIYFRIPDLEIVWVGHYNEVHRQMTAAQASALVMRQTSMTGVEVIIPRKISAKEIKSVRKLPQWVGWRHYPEAHGKPPWTCDCCQRGMYGSRKIRERFLGT